MFHHLVAMCYPSAWSISVNRRLGRQAGRFVVGQVLVLLALFSGAGVRPTVAQTNTAEISRHRQRHVGRRAAGRDRHRAHPASGIVVERVTDGEGRFFLPALRIGEWDVTGVLGGLCSPDADGHHASKSAGR